MNIDVNNAPLHEAGAPIYQLSQPQAGISADGRWTFKRGVALVTLPVTLPAILTTSILMTSVSLVGVVMLATGEACCESAVPPEGAPYERCCLPVIYTLKSAKKLVLYVWKGN